MVFWRVSSGADGADTGDNCFCWRDGSLAERRRRRVKDLPVDVRVSEMILPLGDDEGGWVVLPLRFEFLVDSSRLRVAMDESLLSRYSSSMSVGVYSSGMCCTRVPIDS